jgi:Family of unknown function (DUF5317)
MLALGLAVAVALLLPLLTGGSYTRLVMTDWRWSAALFAGLGLQLALEFLPIPESRWNDLGFGLLLASYALILAFCARNVLLRGMAVVLIGVICNFTVIAVNRGMPVKVPPDWLSKSWVEPTIKHHPEDSSDTLVFLGDIIVLRSPFDAAISFGDLIIAVGLCDVTYHASRKRKRRSSDTGGDATAEPRTIDLTAYPEPTAVPHASPTQTPTPVPATAAMAQADLTFSPTATSSAFSTGSS